MSEGDIIMSDCLVIIDVQKGFLTENTCCVPDRIKDLVGKKSFSHVVATRFINSVNSPHYRITNWKGLMDNKSQEFDDYIAQIAEKIFDKSINSCFSSEFLDYLKQENIDKLYFVGIDTDCCVLKSAFDCFDKGIPFEVLTECCLSTAGIEIHNAACKILLRNFGEECIK